ncbi:hypothetical protein PoB_007255700 [Plakobranchus ocellatus]|uniref:Uncharacterized protein n=1 Tax=Plakobranchus ocellatus TaxID=259542 RepID=A0AAV4DNW0_9GAST|nr:hypothetical protein PoB_007255700 [Plakobranchus ocellatus]
MWVVGGSIANELALKIYRLIAVVCSSKLYKGLEAWDHLVVGRHFAPIASTSSLSVRDDHRKHPLRSPSCYSGTLAKEFTGYGFSSLATVVLVSPCNLLARVGSHQICSIRWR